MKRRLSIILAISFLLHPLSAFADFAAPETIETPAPIFYFLHHKDDTLLGILAISPIARVEADLKFVWAYAPVDQDLLKSDFNTESNGTALTKATSTRTGGMASEIWYLVNPATGSSTVSVTIAGDTDAIKLAASSFTGVDQSTPLDALGYARGTSGNPTANITTATANALVTATLSRFGTTDATTNRTSIYNDSITSTLGAASYQLATTAGSYSDTYTGSASADWSMAMAAFKPARSTAAYYVHTDHLSGSNAITNESDELVQTLDYYPFGSLRVNKQEANFNEKRKFTGHEYDASTELSYMGARYQNGTQGRFLSQDPAGWNRVEKLVSDPQLLNSYAYARNNPIAMVDRDGELPHLVVAAGIGVVLNVGILAASDGINGRFSGWNAYGGAAVGGAVEGVLVGSGVGLLFSGTAGGVTEGATREGLDYFVGDGKFQGGSVAKEGATGFVSSFLGNQLTKRLGDVAVPAITKGQGSFAHVANTQMTKLANNTIGSVSPTTFGKMVLSNAVGGAYTHGTNVGLNVGASGYGNYQSNPMIYESLQYQINQLQKQVAEIQRVVGSLKK